jgi:hypothetical protein
VSTILRLFTLSLRANCEYFALAISLQMVTKIEKHVKQQFQAWSLGIIVCGLHNSDGLIASQSKKFANARQVTKAIYSGE